METMDNAEHVLFPEDYFLDKLVFSLLDDGHDVKTEAISDYKNVIEILTSLENVEEMAKDDIGPEDYMDALGTTNGDGSLGANVHSQDKTDDFVDGENKPHDPEFSETLDQDSENANEAAEVTEYEKVKIIPENDEPPFHDSQEIESQLELEDVHETEEINWFLFKCKHCEQREHRKAHLKSRMKTGHEEKSNFCNQCDDGCRRICRMKKRVKFVHGSRTHERSDCGFSSKQRNSVKNHSASIHEEENMEIFLHRVWDPGGLTLRVLHLHPYYSLPDDLSPDSSLPHDVSVSHFTPATWPDH